MRRTDDTGTGGPVAGPAVAALRSAFRGLAAVRHARAVHPAGVLFTGELTGEPGTGLPFPARSAVLVRLSKGAGTSGALPDVLGLAVRVGGGSGDTAGTDGSWDLLLSSAGTGLLTRFLPLPARRWSSARYGTLLPYRTGERLVWFIAVPEPAEPPARFVLLAVGVGGDRRPVARLELTGEAPPGTEVTFDPMLRPPPGMTLAPAWATRLREAAYAGIRRGRHAAGG